MKSHSDNRWPEYTVPELFEKLPVGKRYEQKSVFPKGNVPVIDQGRSGVIGYHNEEPGVRASEQNPIVTFANHTCQISLQTRDFSVIQNVFPLKARAGFDICFLYFLTKDSIHFSEYKGHWPDFERLKFQVPPIEVQIKIAKILGDLDRKIELNRRMNETLEQIGQTLFKKYFVDNPESKGWDTKPLDEVADFKNGLACQKYPAAKGDQTLRVIKIKEMSSGFTTNSDVVGSSFPSDYIIENGDLLFAWSGTLMTKIWTEGPGALNQHIFKVTSNEYSKWFYYQWVNEHLERFVMIAKSKAVTMGHIKRSHLSEVNVKIPPKTYLKRFDGLLSSLLEQQTSIAVENNTLISLRDNLLPKLMSGEIKT